MRCVSGRVAGALGHRPSVALYVGLSATVVLISSVTRWFLLPRSRRPRFVNLLFSGRWISALGFGGAGGPRAGDGAQKQLAAAEDPGEADGHAHPATHRRTGQELEGRAEEHSDSEESRGSDTDVEDVMVEPRSSLVHDDPDGLRSLVRTRIPLVKKGRTSGQGVAKSADDDALGNVAACSEGVSGGCAGAAYLAPEQHRVYTKTFGCSHNGSDSEFMMGLLESHGYQFTEDLEAATICLINSCTVKNPSQDAFMTVVRRAQDLGKPVVVAGCVPQADRELKGLEKVSIIGTTQIAKIVDVFEETLKGNRVCWLSKGELPSLDIPKIRRNRLIEIIPISSGCLGACTYCKTRHARGRLGSYTQDAIVRRIRTAVAEGVQQIWFTSEDVGAYGIDIGSNIAELLHTCLKTLEDVEKETGKRIMMRIGMTNPPYMARHIESIAAALNHRNSFRFIHIPVQSGSTEVLEKMVREYTIDDFTNLVDKLVQLVPNITVATDIICGFPSETTADHQKTLELVQRYQFPIINISQFYPRPGTPAARMTRVPTEIVKNRSSEISAAFRSYKRTDFLMGSYQRVWFVDVNTVQSQTVGHTVHYIKVVVPLDPTLLGTSCWVHITGTAKWQVEGEIIKPPNNAPGDFDKIDCIYDSDTKRQLLLV